MTDYTATARREGRWWVVQCVEEPNAITQVARLDQVDEYLRESLAFVTGTTEDAVGHIQVVPEVPNIGDQLADLRRLQQGAAEIESTARALNRRVAGSLSSAGLTVRDVGAVLGVSYQRAHQIIADAKAAQPFDDDTLRAWTAAVNEVLADATTPMPELLAPPKKVARRPRREADTADTGPRSRRTRSSATGRT